ncbi:bifunctional homocysteine S-methyltransferase/methylenetetrahydrofolate reductase, partial [Cytophagia bacterium CHB2]|nr:bifunctional homocysteine S-methyltransferase/methylenetetrahydrofolate reductase [Cytophagia bacterium CHB2]
MKVSFLEHLQQDLLVADGAMGTMIYSQGVALSQSFDQLNLTQPDLIRGIHQAYVQAGAQAIETNSFTANRKRLARFGLENSVAEINLAAVRLAREAADEQAYVLASIGPVRDRASEEMESADIRQLFAEHISALAQGRPDALLFETFTVVSELEIAVEEARRLSSIPIIAQVVADEEGYTSDGQHVTAIFKRLRELGAAVVGINCAKGPAGILKALRDVPLEESLLLSAFPNAGLPAFVDGRYIYLSTPEYFGEAALKLRQQGVRLIGGCCGTTPEHVQMMANTLRGLKPVTEKTIVLRPAPAPPSLQKIIEPDFLQKVRTQPSIIVELDPPRDLDFEPIVEGARALKRAGVD